MKLSRLSQAPTVPGAYPYHSTYNTQIIIICFVTDQYHLSINTLRETSGLIYFCGPTAQLHAVLITKIFNK